eukprot:TRINITY_DN5253_c0_g1_i1.p1 TRINITY_DN5253_c0_g1~~TRINITY_DN5253_c0_g1_i1.p1  ORF type:complete len:407 (+),score=85.04 TRINITY_DN5253_c0_g1_i1:158-1378(+)
MALNRTSLLLTRPLRGLACPAIARLSSETHSMDVKDAWKRTQAEHFPDSDKLNKWMTGYYKTVVVKDEDKGSLVVGALMSMLEQNLFCGLNSLSTSVFWANVLKPVSADDCTMLFRDFVQVCNTSTDIASPEEQCDTFLRALFWKNDPELDVFLEDYCNTSVKDAEMHPGANPQDPLWQVRMEMIKSLFPEDASVRDQLRVPVSEWDLPVSNLPEFRAVVLDGQPRPYSYTAFHYFRLWDLQQLARSDPAEFKTAVLPVAGSLSGVILDSLWASYFATGDTASLYRVAQVAGEGLRKMSEQKGEKGVTKFIRALMASRDPVKSLKKLDQDAEARLVTQVGASACLSLLTNSSDEHVWGLLQARSDELADSTAEQDKEFVSTMKMLSVVKAAQDISQLQERQAGLSQ